MKYLLIVVGLLLWAAFCVGLHHDPVRPQCAECILSLLKNGKWYAATRLLKQFEPISDINACQADGITVLHYLVGRGFSQQWMDGLLAAGARINGQTAKGDTPFKIAVIARNYHAARVLAEAGAYIDVELPQDKTPLHFFCSCPWFLYELESQLARNQTEAPLIKFVKRLLVPAQPPALKEQIVKQHYKRLLQPEVFCRLIPELQVEVLFAILQKNLWFDMNDLFFIKDNLPTLQLFKARIEGDSLAHLPVNKKDAEGNTVLHIFARSQYVRVMHFFVQNGADRLIKNHTGLSPRGVIPHHELSYLPFVRHSAQYLEQPQHIVKKIDEILISKQAEKNESKHSNSRVQ